MPPRHHRFGRHGYRPHRGNYYGGPYWPYYTTPLYPDPQVIVVKSSTPQPSTQPQVLQHPIVHPARDLTKSRGTSTTQWILMILLVVAIAAVAVYAFKS